MARERIQKILAAAGFGSRRTCEEMVLEGRVTVNGAPIRGLPALVDPQHDQIAVDGRPVRPQRMVYFLLNKPPGVFCTHNDPAGRKRAVDLLTGVRERVFPVGRLDSESMGLLLLTNDGELTQRLTHPRFGVPKTYRAEIDGVPAEETLNRVREGIWLSEGRTAPAKIDIVHRQRDRCILEITMRESRNREIRRMLARLGHKVRRMTRIRMGKLSIARLPLGAFRPLTPDEIRYLQKMVAGIDSVDVLHSPPLPRQAGRPHRPARPMHTRGRGGPASARRPRSAPRQRETRKTDWKKTAASGRRIIMPEE